MGETRGPDLRELYQREIKVRAFQADPAQLAAIERLNDLCVRLSRTERARSSFGAKVLSKLGARKKAAMQPPRGLYLWGGVGRGKTWLMDLFYRSLPFPERRRRHFHRFMHDVHTELKSLNGIENPLDTVAERVASEARVLCFDELYVSDIADAMILGGLFAALFDRGVALVMTSNIPPRDLYKGGLQRQRFLPAIKLLEEHTEVLLMDSGTDYRLRQLTQAGTYLLSNAADTPQRLEDLFDDLSDEDDDLEATAADSTPLSIEIEGRQIPIVRESENVVWFDFNAICEGPRSQNDYMEIAREYQSVIVSNVPVMDESYDNAARRFIALVDELYEHRVNLVLSAAASPQELYRGERLRHPFQRTVSRLIEMQSEAYLTEEHRP